MVNCGATGNCPLWIFRKTKFAYELLLDGEAQTFTIQKSKINGFHDMYYLLTARAPAAGLSTIVIRKAVIKKQVATVTIGLS